MKSKTLRFLFFFLYGVLVATGPICMIYMTSPIDLNYRVLWLILPYTLLIMGAMYAVFKVLYPKLFLNGRYLSFFLSLWSLSYAVDVVALETGYYFCSLAGTPHYLHNPFSPWLFLSTLSSSILSAFTMAGFFLWIFYGNHCEQNEFETAYRRCIEEKTSFMRGRIKMLDARKRLIEIGNVLKSDPAEATSLIYDLSDHLRGSLYEKGEKGMVGTFLPDPSRHWQPETSRSSAFISGKKYRMLRHLSALGILALMCFGLMFEYPDVPFFDRGHISYTMIFFFVVILLLYANVYLIFPFFLRRERHRLYALLLCSIMLSAFIALNIISLSHGTPYNPFGVRLPWFVVPLGVAANLMTLFLLFAGSASVVLLKENILGKWRLSRLEAQTAEVEFELLQHQINPHTLFNFLNNIAILSYEDADEAALALKSLEEILDYIGADTARKETTLDEEIRFLSNYLTLEKSSGRELHAEISCPAELLSYRIPTLILIPFVENAVKHSRNVENGRAIKIDFRIMEGRLIFSCLNSVASLPATHSGKGNKKGGLGIANTLRRLELLFADGFSLSFHPSPETFKVKLSIMHPEATKIEMNREI